ncbi:MerR family transcriptional regulator [Chryseobacterium koreense]|uniref:Helix-turn-helix domain-containing protein n=1 Tax=Chryseobacterium koreense CCUG 49689 TaxID=1304281 RepID=A0A0J7LQY5_9FLAO|nr:helix-turn-helix domain-containing protein [Chryseobacterium koreense]KMQ71440.1 hypothetical protein ACM44_07425 [Chryseobacterium koreense CCUG 49689]MBB5332282.1 hypothetical protein [Chryseobacterium koreense]
MESLFNLSMAKLEQLHAEQQQLHRQIERGQFPFTEALILEESELAKFLQVTTRTMRKYRKQKCFRYIKLGGRIFYLKPLLYVDLVQLCRQIK